MKLFLLFSLASLLVCQIDCRSSKRLSKILNRITSDEQLDDYLNSNNKHSKSEGKDYWEKCKPGVKIDMGKRIVGGEEAKKNAWPWQIHLYRNSDGRGFYHICGGSIVSPDTILTAAHCVINKDDLTSYEAKFFRVVAGDYNMDTNRDGSTQTIDVNSIHVHPDNGKRQDEADLAILKLKTNLIFDENVTNVCLPIEGAKIGRACIATGWGSTESLESRNILRQVQLPILSTRSCLKEYKDSFLPGMLCAGYTDGGKDTCQGDSGGPLVCQNERDRSENKWRLQGVTSWGVGCGQPKYPGVYADVYYYRDWIGKFVTM